MTLSSPVSPPSLRRAALFVALLASVALTACGGAPECGGTDCGGSGGFSGTGGSSGTGGGLGAGGDSGTGGGSQSGGAEAVKRAIGMPATVLALGGVATERGVEAVYLASQANGNMMTYTGTLQQQANGQWSWAQTPTDRLVLRFNDGATNDYVWTTFQGDVTGSVQDFLDRAHSVAFGFTTSTGAQLQVQDVDSGSATQGSVVGTLVDGDLSWSIDVSRQGTRQSEVDSNWAKTERNETFGGSIKSAAADITADERLWTLTPYASGLLVQNLIRTVNDTGSDADGAWGVQDFKVKKAFNNRVPTEVDTYWAAQGSVLRAGAVVGQVRLNRTAVSIDVVLDMDGTTTVLDTQPAQ